MWSGDIHTHYSGLCVILYIKLALYVTVLYKGLHLKYQVMTCTLLHTICGTTQLRSCNDYNKSVACLFQAIGLFINILVGFFINITLFINI